MAGTYFPLYSGNSLIVYVALQDMANPGSYKAGPTIATGDFKYSLDDAALGNVDAQSVAPAASIWVKLTITTVTGDYVKIQCIDQTSPKEWADHAFIVPTHIANIPANVAQVDGASLTAHAAGKLPADVLTWIGTAVTLSGGVPDVNIKTITAGIIAAASFASGALDAVWSTATRLLTAGTNIVLAKGTGLTGLNDLDAAGVRSAVGLGSANLDTQLTTIDDFLDTEIAAIKAKTDNLPASPANEATLTTIAGYVDTEVAAILAAVDTEVAAIKAKTDQLVFTVPNQVDANALTGGGGGGLDAAGVRDALGMASADLDDQLAALPTAEQNADAMLKRDWTAVTGEASRSVLNALRFIRNKFSTTANPGFVTVYGEDDATAKYTKALTTDAGAEPIVEG